MKRRHNYRKLEPNSLSHVTAWIPQKCMKLTNVRDLRLWQQYWQLPVYSGMWPRGLELTEHSTTFRRTVLSLSSGSRIEEGKHKYCLREMAVTYQHASALARPQVFVMSPSVREDVPTAGPLPRPCQVLDEGRQKHIWQSSVTKISHYWLQSRVWHATQTLTNTTCVKNWKKISLCSLANMKHSRVFKNFNVSAKQNILISSMCDP